ncbi:MAG TPA: DUF86 domain-containing protein [Thermoanaerobaculia bacterium]|nr:DUF86 domain-containing protein [Thermoanaerobaculia bacterium]
MRLHHMLDAAREAVQLSTGKSREEFGKERLLQLSLTHLIEIVGEAASRIPPEIRQRYAAIPWPLVIGIRNRLVHGYDTVDLDIVWNTVSESLPPFIRALEEALADR